MKPIVTILSTGSELTAGRSIDTNSGWIAVQLGELGWKVNRFVVMPDDPRIILSELKALQLQAKENPDVPSLVIMTGGLGATEDDYTLQCALELSGQKMVINEKANIRLKSLYAARGKSYTDILPTVMRQIHYPENSYVLENGSGLAVGFVLNLSENAYLACMPGVPTEMKDMYKKRLLPFLKRTFEKGELYQKNRWIWGIGESLFQAEFISKQKDLLDAGMEWGVTAQKGFIKAIFQAEREDLVDQAIARLKDAYPNQNTEDVFSFLHETLRLNKQTISVAESCTGGLLGGKITDVPGSSAYFLGGHLVYSNEQKINLLGVSADLIGKFGAVSEEVCKAMLVGLEKSIPSDFQLAITGIAGPEGGSEDKPVGTIWIGRKRKGSDPEAFLYQMPGNREMVRESAVNTALYLLSKLLK
ncbi:CinA-like protein [Leptospira ryugenii]|uniref:CinA-like protein n=1 Tax=Leptospira ryugenii TaxID=1917863 RepID=A0A2P2DVU1_9LEPT|nr:nicotinamide-nucleotide amidohydrolase family protein [Leptospira ryugenii]GBF48745.1 CinA-like protein [Leptospira ryugenii]